jgi:hypothetical protein
MSKNKEMPLLAKQRVEAVDGHNPRQALRFPRVCAQHTAMRRV